ncbi:MAG: T9SS type A sorting domain-containing protein [Dysgonamonadaceae bacterium]|jgi:hypothetical protein|nr:T9SS type A sorting domain-containing protein [Dysgonamonadaceae bacterium]
MKKIILIFATLGIFNSFVFPATFTLKYGNTNLSSKTVYVYQNGKRIASGNTSSSGTVSFSLSTGNYSYKTETNFTGDITASSTVTLDHKKLTFTVKDNSGNPISSEYIQIYEDGIEVDYEFTNSSGIAEFYLKPSDKYAYKTSFSQGAVLNDVSLNLIKNTYIEETYNVSIIAKYQNYPVAEQFTLYSYNNKNTTLGSKSSTATNGEVEFNISTGRYWLKNKLNIYTELNIANTNAQFILDYKKVRFIFNQTDPNILENITVSNGSYTDTKITDGKGYADFYLLPETYTYSHLGMSEPFTVTNDTIINLTTQTVIFNLRNGETSAAYANQSFKIGKYMNSLSSYTTNSSGICQIQLMAGNYIFSDGISSYPFTVSSDGQTIIPPLYDVTFNITQNIPNASLSSVYLTSVTTGNLVTYSSYYDGMKLCLLAGDYTMRCYGDNFPNSLSLPFSVTQNTTLQGFYTFQLIVTDNNNTAIAGQSYYIMQGGSIINSSFTTNNQGIATAYLPNGNYQLRNPKTQGETPFVINNQNQTFNLQLPSEVTLNVTKDGEAFSGYIILYGEQKMAAQLLQINNGTGKFQLNTGDIYYAVLSATGSTSAYSRFTVSSNNNLNFISLKIQSEGKGLAFPYYADKSYMDVYNVYYLAGTTVTFSGVPMNGWKCEKWIINGTDVNSDMIDYTLNTATVATAVFEQNSSTGTEVFSLRAANDNNLTIYPNPADTHVSFSENISGNASIYSSNGNLVKQVYVLGNSINVSDLTAGIYVLVVENENQSYRGSFIKQ